MFKFSLFSMLSLLLKRTLNKNKMLQNFDVSVVSKFDINVIVHFYALLPIKLI